MDAASARCRWRHHGGRPRAARDAGRSGSPWRSRRRSSSTARQTRSHRATAAVGVPEGPPYFEELLRFILRERGPAVPERTDHPRHPHGERAGHSRGSAQRGQPPGRPEPGVDLRSPVPAPDRDRESRRIRRSERREHPRAGAAIGRLAEALAKCGFVERSGQGADRMFEESIVREAAARLRRHGRVPGVAHAARRDSGRGVSASSGTDRAGDARAALTTDLVVLDLVHRSQEIPKALASRVPLLLEKRVLEKRGRSKLMLSSRFYEFVGKRGE